MIEVDSPLGAQLKEARQAKNLSLQELHLLTKIKEAYLEAMEADQFDALPASVYAKGFLKICAEVLELDGEALLAQYKRMYPEKENKIGRILKQNEESFLVRLLKIFKKKDGVIRRD